MKQHRTLRRGLGILLTLTMGLCLLASTALAEATQTADFINSPTDALRLLTDGDGSRATWKNKTLTLNGVNFSTSAEIAVLLPADATIQLEKGTTNTIKSTNSDQTKENSYGIYCGGNMYIGGPGGTLTVTGGAAESRSDGISVTGDLNIYGGTVGATGGNAGSSAGIRSEGIVTIEGDAVTAKGSAAKNSYGISAREVKITGGTVGAIGGDAETGESVGIWTNAAVTISDDAEVTATGGTAAHSSFGICTIYAGVTISGGTVTATGSSAALMSHGIWTENGDINISGGHVTAKTLATTATKKSALCVGVMGDGKLDLSSYTNYQWRTSSGGDFTVSTDTEYTYDAADTYVEFSPVPVTCTVSFYANGGSGSMPDVTVVSGNDYTLPACGFTAPVGKMFKEWYVNGKTYAVGDSITISSNILVVAVWEDDPDAGCYQTADFDNDPDVALALLNAAKTGTADSTWESSTKTLTLNGVSFTTSADIAVQLPGGSTIVLAEGTSNTITSTSVSSNWSTICYGILVKEGNLTVKGSGELAVTGGGTVKSNGIDVYHGVLIIESGTVSFTGSTASTASYGVFTDYGVKISGGIVNATGGEVTGSTGSSIGICTAGSVTVTGGAVTAKGGTSAYNSYGIRTGNDSAYTVIVTDGDVTAIGGKASNQSYGIDSSTKPTISGGHVTAQALGDDSATWKFALRYAPDLSGYAGYQWRIDKNADYTSSATAEYPYSEDHTYVEFSQGPITYTVSFDANGGSGDMAQVTGVSGSYSLPACGFTAPGGKTFKGWATSAAGEVISGASISVTANTTLYAVWESIPATGTADFTGDTDAALKLLTNGDTSKAVWTGSTLTLTLKGVSFSTEAATAVKLPAGSTIVLASGTTNIITSTSPQTSTGNSYGILVEGGALTIQGSGKLDVTGGGAAGRSDGISVTGDVTITGGAVDATGSGNANSSTGIDAGGTVKITSGTVTATGSNATANSHGIYAWGVEIEGGTVNAISGSVSEQSLCIFANDNITISGDDTVVTAKGGTANYSLGLQANDVGVTISGGHVTVTGQPALKKAPDLSKYPTGYQWRTSSGGDFTVSSITPYTYDAAHTYVEFKPAYAVSFNANGGSGTMDAVTGVSGSYTLPACTFTAPAGRQFKGWATSAAGKVISDTSISVTANTTLYAVWESIPVNGTADFTIGNDSAALQLLTNGSTSNAQWDSTSKTLTLNGVDFSTSAEIAVKLPAGSTIVLADGTKNTITSTNPDQTKLTCYGIYVDGSLTIRGSGTLTVTSGAADTASRGIYARGDLTITGGTVGANGGTNAGSSVGLFSDSTMKIQGGKVTATGGAALRSSGGISAYDVVISGGTVAATGAGNDSIERSFGIFASNNVTISGEDTVVTAKGGTALNVSYGIQAQFGDVTISGGSVTATGNTAEDSFGIYAQSEAIAISGGHVIAETLATASGAPATAARTLATTATNQSALNKAPDLSKYTGYRWRTASSGDYTASTDTPYAFDTAHTYVEFSGVDTANLADLPRTGDDSSLLLWIALLLASCLGVTGIVVYGKRNQRAK